MDILLVTSNLGLPDSPSSNHICDRIESLRGYRDINMHGITESYPHISCGIPLRVIERGVSGRCGGQIAKILNCLQKSRIFGKNRTLALREALRGYRDRFFLEIKGDKTDKFGNWSLISAYEKVIIETICDNDFDLIYTTGGPATVHIAAARALEEIHIPWVAEIQDPLLFEGIDGPTYKPSKRDLDHLYLAEECLKKADAVICLTETCAECYRARLKKASVHSIYPGSNVRCIPAKDLKRADRTLETVNVFHGGTLAGDRNLDVLLKAIHDAGLDEGISLTLAGYVDDGVRERIASVPFIRYLGVVSRDETARQIDRNDVCLVVQNRSSVSRYTLPSKFYEYTALSSPVLFLGYNNDEVRRNSSTYNFYYCDQQDLSEVSGSLHQVVSDHRNGRMRRPVNLDITLATDQFVKLCRNVSG